MERVFEVAFCTQVTAPDERAAIIEARKRVANSEPAVFVTTSLINARSKSCHLRNHIAVLNYEKKQRLEEILNELASRKCPEVMRARALQAEARNLMCWRRIL